MQEGFFVTRVKAPLSTQIPKKEIGVPQRKTYSTKFLWIPFITPSVSITDYGASLNGNYADYEYFSLLFGIYQSVDIITYE